MNPWKSISLLFAALALLATGCDNSRQQYQQQRPLPQVERMQSSVSAQDFALNAIGGLIQNGTSNAQALEQEINKPDEPNNPNPYTRVDTNGDNQRDYIQVRETIPQKEFEFVAHPGASAPDQSIAKIDFEVANGVVNYNANYTSYVNGYDDPMYRYRGSFAQDLAFFTWLSLASRPAYIGVMPMGYSYSRVVPRQQFVTHQTTTFQQSRINPTPVAPRSATVDSSRYASKVTPTVAPRGNSASLSQATQGMAPIRKDNANVQVQRGAFDNTPRSASPAPAQRSISTPAPVQRSAPIVSRPASASRSKR